MPAGDRPTRSRPSLATAHAPHGSDERERPPGCIGVDECLRPTWVEDKPVARFLVMLGVEVVNRSVAWLSRACSCVIARACDLFEVTPIAVPRRIDQLREDSCGAAALGCCCEAHVWVLAHVVDEPVARPRRQRRRSPWECTDERGRSGETAGVRIAAPGDAERGQYRESERCCRNLPWLEFSTIANRAVIRHHGFASRVQRFSTTFLTSGRPIAPASVNAPAAKTFAPRAVS